MFALFALSLVCFHAYYVSCEEYFVPENISVDEIIKNDRLTRNYLDCVLEKGKCTSEGEQLKSKYIFRFSRISNLWLFQRRSPRFYKISAPSAAKSTRRLLRKCFTTWLRRSLNGGRKLRVNLTHKANIRKSTMTTWRKKDWFISRFVLYLYLLYPCTSLPVTLFPCKKRCLR